ncbi:MAG: helix-turn-helix domain-containing protein [Actinomycetota bacterium]
MVLHRTLVAWVPSGVGHVASGVADLGIARFARSPSTPLYGQPALVLVDPVVVPALGFVARGPHRPGAAELLAVAVEQLRAGMERSDPVLPLPVDPGARAVAERLLTDPSDQRGVGAWALVARCSERTLRRRFDDETGLPFAAWRQQARLRHARGLLADGEPVDSAARRSGFRSRAAFARSFKAETGMTPTEYAARPTSGEAQWPAEQRIGPPLHRHRPETSEMASTSAAAEGPDMFSTRRLATVTVAVGLLATACGSDDDVGDAASSSSPAATTAETASTDTTGTSGSNADNESAVPETTEATFPRTLIDPAGNEVTIEAQPERVVVAGDRSELDYLLALGVVPVQISTNRFLEDTEVFDGDSIMPFQQEVIDSSDVELAKVRGVGTDPTDPEDILPADPDLIIGFEYQVGDARTQLEAIAPVFTYEFSTWQDNVRSLGVALGLDDRAEQLISGWEQQLADVFADLDVPEGTTYAFVDAYPPEAALYITPDAGYGPNVLFEAAGFSRLDSYDEIEDFTVSYERVDLLDDADVIVFVDYDPDPTLAQQFIDDPIGQSIPAVADGRYLILQQGEAAQAMDRLSPINLEEAAGPVIEAAALVASR